MRKNRKNNKGFSLVELVIVVAILAILVGILAPQYTKYVERSRKSADASNVDNIVTAIKVAAADESFDIKADTYTITLGDNSCTVKAGTAANSAGISAALTEYIGTGKFTEASGTLTATSIVKKSKKWTSDISVVVTVETSGAVKVGEYTPADFATYVKSGAEPTTAPVKPGA